MINNWQNVVFNINYRINLLTFGWKAPNNFPTSILSSNIKNYHGSEHVSTKIHGIFGIDLKQAVNHSCMFHKTEIFHHRIITESFRLEKTYRVQL